MRVVIAFGVDHQRLEHFLHLARHFFLERPELLCAVDELRDVVVRVGALACLQQALANALRNGLRIPQAARCGFSGSGHARTGSDGFAWSFHALHRDGRNLGTGTIADFSRRHA